MIRVIAPLVILTLPFIYSAKYAAAAPIVREDPGTDPGGSLAKCTGCARKHSGEEHEDGTRDAYSAESAPFRGATLLVRERYTNFSQNCTNTTVNPYGNFCSSQTCKTGWNLEMKVSGGPADVYMIKDNQVTTVFPGAGGGTWSVAETESRIARVCGWTFTYSGILSLSSVVTPPQTSSSPGAVVYEITGGCNDCSAP